MLTVISLPNAINCKKKKILPLTELTGVRPGEEGKSPGSATKAKLENTSVKEGKTSNANS